VIAFTDGVALICAIPSNTQNGVYLVRAEPQGNKLIVSHDCPAARFGNECRHVPVTVAAYERYHWWEPKKRVVIVPKRIVLHPDWQQIELPLSPEELVRAVIGYVT